MIAFHKRNFPLHRRPQKSLYGGGEVSPKSPPPPPHAHGEKVAKNWQKGHHMKKKAPIKKKRGFFPGGGARAYSAPHAGVHVFIT